MDFVFGHSRVLFFSFFNIAIIAIAQSRIHSLPFVFVRFFFFFFFFFLFCNKNSLPQWSSSPYALVVGVAGGHAAASALRDAPPLTVARVDVRFVPPGAVALFFFFFFFFFFSFFFHSRATT
jgi:hypothetical protein